MAGGDAVVQAAREILGSRKTIALTGAGISVASGIPPFRGKGGLWDRYDPEEYAHIDAFLENPGKVWAMLRELLEVLNRALPNPAHLALAELESMGLLGPIITQNIDGLHQLAGSRDVIEFHGNNRWLVCLSCRSRYSASEVLLDALPPYCGCGGVLKPDAVFFGEPIPRGALFRAHSEASSCELCLVIGTSGLVEPAASLPLTARRCGARIIEFNPEQCLNSDVWVTGGAEDTLPRLVEEVKRLRR